MRLLPLLPLAVLVGCDSGPSKQESVEIYVSASGTLAAAQGAAVTQAGTGEVALDYSGPCPIGGTVALSGSYSDTDPSTSASFDLVATFASCTDGVGTIDGDLHWMATASAAEVRTTMKGDLDWEGRDGGGSCHFDVETVIGETTYTFKGSLCGYDLASEVMLPETRQ